MGMPMACPGRPGLSQRTAMGEERRGATEDSCYLKLGEMWGSAPLKRALVAWNSLYGIEVGVNITHNQCVSCMCEQFLVCHMCLSIAITVDVASTSCISSCVVSCGQSTGI